MAQGHYPLAGEIGLCLGLVLCGTLVSLECLFVLTEDMVIWC